MCFRFNSIALLLAAAALSPPALRGDVLLDGRSPVDRGYGDVVGNEVRWKSCEGNSDTFHNPPFRVIKHKGDCEKLGPMNNVPEPPLFGLTCSGSFPLGTTEVTKNCTVKDEKVFQYFMEKAGKGDRVTYEVHGKDIHLSHGDDRVAVKTDKWRGAAAKTDGRIGLK